MSVVANKLFHSREHADSTLPTSALDVIGRAPNGTPQGSFVIVARNKAEAARIANTVLGNRYSARNLAVAYEGATDTAALIDAGMVDLDQLGQVVAWREHSGIVRWAPGAEGRDAFELVGRWEYSRDDRRQLPLHVDRPAATPDELRAALAVVADWRGRGHLADPELSRALDVVAAAARTTLED